jgi:hypothetical protein
MKVTLELDPRDQEQVSTGRALLSCRGFRTALLRLSNAFGANGKLTVEQFNEILEEAGISLEDRG